MLSPSNTGKITGGVYVDADVRVNAAVEGKAYANDIFFARVCINAALPEAHAQPRARFTVLKSYSAPTLAGGAPTVSGTK